MSEVARQPGAGSARATLTSTFADVGLLECDAVSRYPLARNGAA
jgi:hypothetical protein